MVDGVSRLTFPFNFLSKIQLNFFISFIDIYVIHVRRLHLWNLDVCPHSSSRSSTTASERKPTTKSRELQLETKGLYTVRQKHLLRFIERPVQATFTACCDDLIIRKQEGFIKLLPLKNYLLLLLLNFSISILSSSSVTTFSNFRLKCVGEKMHFCIYHVLQEQIQFLLWFPYFLLLLIPYRSYYAISFLLFCQNHLCRPNQ